MDPRTRWLALLRRTIAQSCFRGTAPLSEPPDPRSNFAACNRFNISIEFIAENNIARPSVGGLPYRGAGPAPDALIGGGP